MCRVERKRTQHVKARAALSRSSRQNPRQLRRQINSTPPSLPLRGGTKSKGVSFDAPQKLSRSVQDSYADNYNVGIAMPNLHLSLCDYNYRGVGEFCFGIFFRILVAKVFYFFYCPSFFR